MGGSSQQSVTERARIGYLGNRHRGTRHDGVAGGDAPPLAGSPWVTGPEERIIKIVLHGVRGRMEIAGEVYDREMPGFGAILSDADVASLVSFVRARFGSAGSATKVETVARVRTRAAGRKDYWSIEELLADK